MNRPTGIELQVILAEARRLRAEEFRRLSTIAFEAVSRLFRRTAPSRNA